MSKRIPSPDHRDRKRSREAKAETIRRRNVRKAKRERF